MCDAGQLAFAESEFGGHMAAWRSSRQKKQRKVGQTEEKEQPRKERPERRLPKRRKIKQTKIEKPPFWRKLKGTSAGAFLIF